MPRLKHAPIALAILALSMVSTSNALGQSGKVELGDGQIDLINQGAEASNGQDYLKAVRILRAALTLGDNNITRLNLGRALQKAGVCDEALEMYERALRAPQVADVDTKGVEQRATEWAEETRTTCPGTLDLRCSPALAAVTIVDASGAHVAAFKCAARPPRLSPGSYTVTVTHKDTVQSSPIIIQAMVATPLQFDLEPRSAVAPNAAVGDTSEGSAPLPLSILVTWAPVVGWATGPLFSEDGSAPTDAILPNGHQDELDGVQISRVAHVLGLESTWGAAPWFVGGIAHLHLPLLAFDAGLQGGVSFADGPWEGRARLQTTWGEVLQPMSADDLNTFAARSGPVWVGAGGSVAWWLHPRFGASFGVDLLAGVPDLGIQLTANIGITTRPL